MITVPWYYLLGGGLLIAIISGLLTKRFGTNWLEFFTWAIGDDEIKAFALIAWDVGLVPAVWKKVRFGNDPGKFADWVLEQVHKLSPEKKAMLIEKAAVRGLKPSS